MEPDGTRRNGTRLQRGMLEAARTVVFPRLQDSRPSVSLGSNFVPHPYVSVNRKSFREFLGAVVAPRFRNHNAVA
jgi:hypothetical protein